MAILSAVAGVVDVSRTDWRKASINFALMVVTTFLVAIVTEEGFPGACPCSAVPSGAPVGSGQRRAAPAPAMAADRLDAAPAARRPEADRKEIGHERTMGVDAAAAAA